MKITQKHYAIISMVVPMISMLLIFFFAKPGTAEGEKTIKVEVVHGNESSVTYTIDTDQEYLGPALEDEKLIVSEEGSFGRFVVEVDGERAVFAEDGAYWALYIGEEYATTGVDDTPIADGDSFSLVYTRDEG